MGVTAAGTPFVFTNVNSLQVSYAKTQELLNQKGMSVTQKSFNSGRAKQEAPGVSMFIT
jgi:hypothetical protein